MALFVISQWAVKVTKSSGAESGDDTVVLAVLALHHQSLCALETGPVQLTGGMGCCSTVRRQPSPWLRGGGRRLGALSSGGDSRRLWLRSRQTVWRSWLWLWLTARERLKSYGRGLWL